MITNQMRRYLEQSSWIRRMFEVGLELKREHGADRVFDFSLGNPDLPPPPGVAATLRQAAERAERPLAFGYVPNAGLPELREALARRLAVEQQVDLPASHTVITCGAAGALNTLFRSILEPGDEVLCPAPFFVEYTFYAENHGGVLRTVDTSHNGFQLEPAAIEAAVTPRTRAVILNSPHNPTGQIYPPETIEALAGVLRRASRGRAQPILLVADEPYRFLTYDGHTVAPVLCAYPDSVIAGSCSKSLSLAGERVGYLAVSPAMQAADELLAGVTLANRILGFVNAPVIGQRILLAALDSGVEVGVYETRRRAMAAVLRAADIEFVMPRGAFYVFPRAPGGDDAAFVDLLRDERILAVPGRGFGTPGFFRLAFCVDEAVIRAAAEGFRRAARRAAAPPT